MRNTQREAEADREREADREGEAPAEPSDLISPMKLNWQEKQNLQDLKLIKRFWSLELLTGSAGASPSRVRLLFIVKQLYPGKRLHSNLIYLDRRMTYLPLHDVLRGMGRVLVR